MSRMGRDGPPQPPSGLEGYLSKQGGGSSAFGRKNWKVRYFVLKNGVLSYFADKKEAQASATPKGSFHVLSISSIRTMPHKDKKFQNQSHREIVLPNRSLVICCDQEEILVKWVDAVNSHINYERKTEHLKKLQIEAQMVEDEMSQQMSFTIMLNVLRRWITIEWQRSLTMWRMNMERERYGGGMASDLDAGRLRRQFEMEKKEEMKKFTEAVKEKWESAVVSLKDEIQALQEENAILRANPREAADDGETMAIRREEFVALMEAAQAGESKRGEVGEAADPLDLRSLQADLQLSRSLAAAAQEQAEQQAKRADSLAARLAAAEHALKAAKGGTGRSASPPPPSRAMPLKVPARTMPPAPVPRSPRRSVSPPRPAAPASPTDENSSWIARYKAIVNSPM